MTGGRIKDESIQAQDVLNNTLTGSDIKDGSVGSVDLASSQAWQAIRDPDDAHCPTADGYFTANCFGPGATFPVWKNDESSVNNDTAYYKDPFGVVHLKGIVCRIGGPTNCQDQQAQAGTRDPILQLPPGYRPAKEWSFDTATGFGDALVMAEPNGFVTVLNGNYAGISLDGIEFRPCGAPGSEACPAPAS